MVVKGLLEFFGVKPTAKAHDMLFSFLYNFIPAFIFAPYLFFVGVKYNLIVLVCMGLVLFLVDLMHFVKAMKKLR